MTETNEMARNLFTQEPGRGKQNGKSASSLPLTYRKASRHRGGVLYHVKTDEGPWFPVVIKGRVRRALELLRTRGAAGATSFDSPTPRLSAYVHSLRELGVYIETLPEPHGGDYPATHGRYLLRSTVTRGGQGGAV